jgi:sulfite reductase (NADPH) flavoprotein alpha-component
MAPVALTSNLTSPPGPPAKKNQAGIVANSGIALDSEGDSTPYSATSTAVSESGEAQKTLVDESLASSRSLPGDNGYFTNLLASSNATTTTKAGSTIFGSAIDVLEALAVQQSQAVWIYDDASEVGFGRRALKWAEEGAQGGEKVFALQTRDGAGLELAGYSNKSSTSGKISVFATLATLPFLLPSLEAIKGDIVIHLATTTPSATLEFTDSLYVPGILKSLTNLPSGWDVVFSAGSDIVDAASKIYGSSGKVIQVVESTFSGRETLSYKFPSTQSTEGAGFEFTHKDAEDIYVLPAGSVASSVAASLPASKGLLTITSLSPNADKLSAALTGEKRKTLSIAPSLMLKL